MKKLRSPKYITLVAATLLLGNPSLFARAAGTAAWSPDNLVRIDGGWVSGVLNATSDVRIFKGLSYAAPPIGNLRWRPPKPVIAWKGIRHAGNFSSSCIQIKLEPTSIFYDDPHPTSEDCLYLNVWTAAMSPLDRLPVLVWIHDGAFLWGEGTRPVADGEALARKGAVIVTINYRLGVLGFLAHPKLSRESSQHISGNYGLLDMIAAIKWTRKNIAAFGGDPTRITLFGESAGSRAVGALYTSPLTRGYISGVIAADSVFAGALSLADAERAGADFVKSSGATSIDQLRRMPAGKLFPSSYLDAQKKGYFGPLVDGITLTSASVLTAEKNGMGQDIPILTGLTADYGSVIASPISSDLFKKQNRDTYGDQADQFLKLYPAASDAQAGSSERNLITDSTTWTHDKWAALHTQNGRRAYLYRFTHRPPVPPNARYTITGDPLPTQLGVFHTGEICYLFDSLAKLREPWTPEDYHVADRVSSYVINFAMKGDPNGPGLPRWPAYGDGPQSVMELGDAMRTAPPGLAKDKYELWSAVYRKFGLD